MPVNLSDAQRARLSAVVPAGLDLDELRALEVTAQAVPGDHLSAAERAVVANVTKAGAPMINKDGRPTILRVVAWICHGDVTNRNGDQFVKEELQALAPTLFREPNFGVMDWNHAAVYSFNDDPKIIGVWYGAEYAFDQAAQAWGLLAKGMAFAWLFPEQTDALVAEQLRSGTAKFSMACIPKSVEFRDGAAVLHNPVFFTVSALDKAPADPNATGKVSEDPTQDHTALQQELLATHAAAAGAPPAKHSKEDLRMDPQEMIAKLTAEKLAAEARANEMSAEKSALEVRLIKAEQQGTESTATVASLTAEVATLKTRVSELETSLTEASTARAALAEELKAAQAQIDTITAEKAALAEKVAAVEAKEQEAARVTLLATRKAELPEVYRKAHDARKEEDRTKVEARWATMTDEQWAEHKSELLVGFDTSKPNYAARSAAEGELPASTSGEDSPMARVARHIIKR